jgi:cytochrome c553
MMKRMLLITTLLTITISASTAEPVTTAIYHGDPVKGQALAAGICSACHTPDGNSLVPIYPKLASQHADYLYKQMKDFQAADGKQPARVNAIMNSMIAPYNDEQKRDLAAWFSSQAEKNEAATGSSDTALGQKIFRAGIADKGLPACAGCHGPTGAGIPSQYPRVAGQFGDYIELQLKSFRDESRADDPNKMMRMIALKMTDAEIKAVADYITKLH